jgi:hypothetical protein
MVNRDQLIAYLLHQIPEHEREAFSERWFTDAELCEELRMAEADLLDTYARGKASGEQRALIERWLLGSSTQEQKLDFARALAAALPQGSSKGADARREALEGTRSIIGRHAPPRDRFARLLTNRRRFPLATLGAAAAALALLVSVPLLIVRNRHLETELARVESQAQSQRQAQSLPGAAYAVFLPADTLRSAAGNWLRIPKSAAVLHLELGLDPGQERELDSAVLSISGRDIWRQQPVRAEGATSAMRASLWIPAGLFRPGNYTLKLESHGAPVAYYSFAVLP